MTIDEIQTVCFVGAGTMGCANSLVAAASGYDVVITDARAEGLDAVAARHAEIGAFLVQVGYCTEGGLADALERVALEPGLVAATADADLVSESVFENIDIKREVFRELDRVAPAHTILTTNTSTLLVSDLEDSVARGDRFAALHSHLGALLFDIVGGPRTSPETIDTLERYVLSVGGVPLVLNKEHPGYVFNALNGALLSMALRLVLDDHATVGEVDRAWMSDRNAPMGPFGMMDLFGLDLVLDTWRRPRDDGDRQALARKVVPFLEARVENGRLGLKSGSGFYDYPEPAFQQPGFCDHVAPSVATDALVVALISSAVSLAAAEVASASDIDMAWRTATGLDVGPLEILSTRGAPTYLEHMDELVSVGLVRADTAREARALLAQLAERPH